MTNTTNRNAAHAANMDAAQRAMDARAACGEDMSAMRIDPKTYEIVADKTIEFAVGDRVFVTLPQTGEVPASGTIQKIGGGWYVVLLDQPECFPLSKAGIVSARKDRMTAMAAVESQQNEDEDDGEDVLGEDCDAEESDELEEALEEAETAASKMAEALRKARVHYQKTRRPAGAASADCADLIAKELRDYEPLEVAGIADRCFDLPKGTHAEKYAHLNNGQIRMNCGNKIRAAWKKGDEAIRTRIAFVLGLQDELADELAAEAEESIDA